MSDEEQQKYERILNVYVKPTKKNNKPPQKAMNFDLSMASVYDQEVIPEQSMENRNSVELKKDEEKNDDAQEDKAD